MKKIFLSALLIGGAAVAANAQANSVLVYGELGIGTTKSATDDKTFNFRFNPGIGYQFNDNWTVGLAGGFNTMRVRANKAKDWSFVNGYNAGVFVRHTMPVGKIFALFSHLEAGYMGTATGTTASNSTYNSNGFYARLTPAIAVYVVDGLALNFGFGGVEFNSLKFEGATQANTSFDLTWGSQFNIGVSKNIFCGKMKHHRHKGGHKMNHGSRVEREEGDDVESED